MKWFMFQILTLSIVLVSSVSLAEDKPAAQQQLQHPSGVNHAAPIHKKVHGRGTHHNNALKVTDAGTAAAAQAEKARVLGFLRQFVVSRTITSESEAHKKGDGFVSHEKTTTFTSAAATENGLKITIEEKGVERHHETNEKGHKGAYIKTMPFEVVQKYRNSGKKRKQNDWLWYFLLQVSRYDG